MKKISIILPCLNESQNLPLLIPEIVKNIPQKYDYEIICVDDGSNDGTDRFIENITQINKRVKGIIFHRRFGHQSALRAGINQSKGDVVITMDSDFQHPPELLPQLIKMWEKGFDLVLPQKKEDYTKNVLYKLNRQIVYQLWTWVSDSVLIPGVSDFRLMDKKVAEFISNSSESEIFLRGLINLAAKKSIIIPYKVKSRRFGKSSYSLRSLINFFINGFISFSTKPLRIASLFGLLIAAVATIFLFVDILHSIILGRGIIPGWLTLVVLVLVLNGFIIFYMGILGEYIGVIFKEVKKRPSYLIQKTFNL